MLTLIVIVLLLVFLIGAPLFAVMTGLAMVGAESTARSGFFNEFGGYLVNVQRIGTGEEAQILSTIPLFILAGYIMAESKTADRMVRFAQATLGWLPGGLAIVTILACAVFTTFTGASGVTIVALGGLIMPALIRERYPRKFSLGLITGTGSVGLLFPPALPLFVFGTVYGIQQQLSGGGDFETSRFLFAGIVPGMVLVGILCIFAVIIAIIRKVPRQKFDFKELVVSGTIALPETLIPVLVIGALANGVNIPEVASLTVVYVMFVEIVVYRNFPETAMWRIAREAMALVGAIFIIIFAASALTGYFVTAEIPQMLVDWVGEHVDNKWTFLLALNLLLIVVGMLMDIFSAIVIVVPLIAPIARQYGVDPYHLGVIFLLNLEIGYLTPPVGLNLFITAFKFQRPVTEVIRASVPFLLAMILALGLVTYLPWLTVVPPAKRTGKIANLVSLVQDAKRGLQYVQEVTLPDGEVKTFSQCSDIADEMERLTCEELFENVTNCRDENDGEAGSKCEKRAIKEWVMDNDLDAGWGDDDDDDSADDDDDDVDESVAEDLKALEGGDSASADDDDDIDEEVAEDLRALEAGEDPTADDDEKKDDADSDTSVEEDLKALEAEVEAEGGGP
jgi:tripartite ATP-independent transporter DctM subunit